jgi:hypothetical protein
VSYETPKWLTENHPETSKPTPIVVPLSLKVGPVWSYKTNTEGTGGWYAAVVIAAFEDLDVQDLWQCDHAHAEKADAWACAVGALIELAEKLGIK